MNLDQQKQRVRGLLGQHEYEAAAEILNRMARLSKPDEQEYADWARRKIAQVKQAIDQYRQNREPALRTATKLIGQHDYLQAAELLEKFPPRFRTEEMKQILERARSRHDEVERLTAEMHDARAKDGGRDRLLAILDRLLKLKPGHHDAQELYRELTEQPEADYSGYSEGFLAGLKREFSTLRGWVMAGIAVILAGWATLTLWPQPAMDQQDEPLRRVAAKPLPPRRPVEPLRPRLTIDGKFDDWASLPEHADPENDTHETTLPESGEPPPFLDHPDADLVAYKVACDDEALYFYFRSRAQIGRTQVAQDPETTPGRYYVNVSIDVDENDETGYSLAEGNYYPLSRGYDFSAEIEFFDGRLNLVRYLNYSAVDAEQVQQALLDLTDGEYTPGHNGPYRPGFVRPAPGSYDYSTEWVYFDDDTIRLVADKGEQTIGMATAALSEDGREIEARFPFKGFLKDESGKPAVALGSVLDLSFTLEASGELAPAGQWASDTGEPLTGYVVQPPTDE